ncbi:MAG: sensory rhodopsin transducer [Deinococcus sp.]|nr:sensory rhodopsin transducer [Deinococcus sp.]
MEGAKTWLIPDGYLPAKGPDGHYAGHDCVCLLNTSSENAMVWLDVYFEDRDPVEDLEVRLAAKRVLHLRMDKPEMLGGFQMPREVPYALRVRSDTPISVQYSRLDVTQANMAFLSTMAFPVTHSRLRKPKLYVKKRRRGKVARTSQNRGGR